MIRFLFSIFCTFYAWMLVAQNSDQIDQAQELYELGKTWDANYQKNVSGLHIDMPKAVEYYLQAARQNYAPALHDLGRIYYYGASYSNIKEDKTKGIAYYEQAANLGFESSMHALGNIYLGYGFNHISENIEKGLYYYRILAQKDDITAIYWLATIHFKPENTIYNEKPKGLQDYQKARQYFEEVIRLEGENNISLGYGYTKETSIYLGVIYRDGLGVLVDYAKAAEYFDLAIKQGDYDYAVAELGWFYLNGLGVKKNLVLAKKYLLQVEEKGISGRKYLAQIYTEGKIVKKDLDKAKMHRSCMLPENETCCFYAECEWNSTKGEWIGN